MVDKIIAEYLKTGRRLIIPELGVFIKREDRDEVIFSTLLTKNDGILLQMIQDRIRMSEEKAGIILHHFVDEINRQLDAIGRFPIEGLGMLVKSGDDIGFIYSGDRNVEIVYRQHMAAVSGNVPAQPQKTQQRHTPEVAPTEQKRQSPTAEETPIRERKRPEWTDGHTGEEEYRGRRMPKTEERESYNNSAHKSSFGAERNYSQPSEPTETHAEKRTDRSFKKTANALFSSDAPTMEAPQKPRPTTAKRRPAASGGKRNEAGRKGIDTVLLLAIVAALIAIGVIIYGWVNSRQTKNDTLLLPTTVEATVLDGDATEGGASAVTPEESAAVHF